MAVPIISDNQCTICLEPVPSDRSYSINCENKDSHTDRIHLACARRWLQEKETCPLCQGVVIDVLMPIVKRSPHYSSLTERIGGASAALLSASYESSPIISRCLATFSETGNERYLNDIVMHVNKGKNEAFEAFKEMINFDITRLSGAAKKQFLVTLQAVIMKNSSKRASILVLFAPVFIQYERCEEFRTHPIFFSIASRMVGRDVVSNICFLHSGPSMTHPEYLRGVIRMVKCSRGPFFNEDAFLKMVKVSVIENGTIYPRLLHDLLLCMLLFKLKHNSFQRLIKKILELNPTLLTEKVRGETVFRHFVTKFASNGYTNLRFFSIVNMLLDLGGDPNERIGGGLTIFQMLYQGMFKNYKPSNNTYQDRVLNEKYRFRHGSNPGNIG